MSQELTLVLLKPDALERSLTGMILNQLSGEGLQIVGAKVVKVSSELAAKHYEEHKGKPFYDELISYIQGGFSMRKKVLALAWFGPDAAARIREKIGPTNPLKKDDEHEPTTIRQRLGRVVPVTAEDGLDLVIDGHVMLRFENAVHGSERGSAEREIKLWFEPEELLPKARIYPTVVRTVRVYDGDTLLNERKVLAWA